MPHRAMSFPSVLCLTSFMPSLLLASIIVMTLSLVYLPLVTHLSGFSKTVDHIIFLFKSHQWYPLIPGKHRTLYTKGLQALLLSDPLALTLTPLLSCFLRSRQAEGRVLSRVCPAAFCLSAFICAPPRFSAVVSPCKIFMKWMGILFLLWQLWDTTMILCNLGCYVTFLIHLECFGIALIQMSY